MEEVKTFAQLVEEKASCFEFAWNGFIRLYEEGEKPCTCKDCVGIQELKEKLNKIRAK